jgi:uncharacterized protein YwqG
VIQTLDDLRQAIREAGLEHLAEPLSALALPSVRLHTVRLHTSPSDVDAFPVGMTKLGGTPDVPAGWQWPTYQEKSLTFIGQINLAETAPYLSGPDLPPAGLLSFFYEADEQPGGYDPKDRNGWKVEYFTQDAAALRRASVPPNVRRLGQLCPCGVRFAFDWTFSEWESDSEMLQDLSDAELDKFFALNLSPDTSGEQFSQHRLLGHPEHIQNEMTMECQLASHGVYCGNASGYRSAEAQTLASGAADWRLLLQIDSDDTLGTMWGDGGRIYFWIRQQDLAARNFNDVWLILQCY